MKNKKLFIAGLVVLIVLILVAAFFVISKISESNNESGESSLIQKIKNVAQDDEPTIKHLGVELAPYDATTKTMGDMQFTDIPLEFNRLFFEYGYEVAANSVGSAKKNPQPTFIVPLGTKVHAIVDGVVVNIPKLYSNDYSVHIASSKNSSTIYEMEHVINVVVKEGDTVKAGDVVAEVSDYDTRNTPGFGLVEIGILKAGNPPKHVCIFDYLDPSFKDEAFSNLNGLFAAWNEYKGQTIYDVSKQVVPGCLTRDEIEG